MDATEIRRLTELAARAVGNQGVWTEFDGMEERIGCQGALYIQDLDTYWNPAQNAGDAFGLMCDLGIDVVFGLTRPCVKAVALGTPRIEEDCTPETRREAARLAVLRAAAAVGEQMDGGS